MNKLSKTTFARSTDLLRWIISLLLLPAATASGIGHTQDGWLIDTSHSVATLSLGSGTDGCKSVWLPFVRSYSIQTTLPIAGEAYTGGGPVAH